MHSVGTDGPVEVASAKADNQTGEQRKVDLIMNEMKRYGMKVVALQQSKWFVCEVYQVGGGIVLTSGGGGGIDSLH